MQHLLQPSTPLALGAETRPASGPPPVGVFRGEIDPAEAKPRSVVLPTQVASGRFAVLHSVAKPVAAPPPLGGPPERRVRVDVVEVDRSGQRPRAWLPQPGGDAPSQLWVKALPLPDAPGETLRASLRVPKAGRLDLGYGLREECWGPEGRPADFRVELVEADGRRRRLLDATLDPRRSEHRRWHDASLDLAAWAGQLVGLELTTTRHGGPGALSLPLWGDPTLYGPSPVEAPPSLVLISLDTLRARSLGAYGYARDTSPFFDALAAQGTLFTRAVTTAASTSPAHMSLFTGLYPVRHGVLSGFQPRAREVPMLAELLRGRGYTTRGFSENGYVDASRFAPGFGRFTENADAAGPSPGLARITFAQAREWLESGPREPFLLFVHTYQVHSPYQPPEAYADLFAGDGVDGPQHPTLRQLRDAYDREIRHVDDELRRLFEGLASRPGAGATLAVVLADHGEEFGEHGRLEHGGSLFDETLRVPLLFWGPGLVPVGVRRDEPVSLIDVTPTLLEFAGLAPPPGIDGTSLAGLIRSGELPPRRRLFAEARTERDWLRDFETARFATPLFAVLDGDAKFVVQRPDAGPRPPILRYDLRHDPEEQSAQELDAVRAAEVDRMLDAYLAAGPPSRAPEGSDALEPELQERLRALGYLR